jgi:hypothetical protein
LAGLRIESRSRAAPMHFRRSGLAEGASLPRRRDRTRWAGAPLQPLPIAIKSVDLASLAHVFMKLGSRVSDWGFRAAGVRASPNFCLFLGLPWRILHDAPRDASPPLVRVVLDGSHEAPGNQARRPRALFPGAHRVWINAQEPGKEDLTHSQQDRWAAQAMQRAHRAEMRIER